MIDQLAPFVLWAGVVVALLLSVWGASRNLNRYVDALGCAGMLALGHSLTTIAALVWDPPACWRLNPILDLAGLVVVGYVWSTRPERWKAVLGGLFLFQLCLHVALSASDKSPYALYGYAVLLNLSFLAQLAVVSWPGGTRLVADIVGPVPGRRSAGDTAFPRP